jgi:hypothetical protein
MPPARPQQQSMVLRPAALLSDKTILVISSNISLPSNQDPGALPSRVSDPSLEPYRHFFLRRCVKAESIYQFIQTSQSIGGGPRGSHTVW